MPERFEPTRLAGLDLASAYSGLLDLLSAGPEESDFLRDVAVLAAALLDQPAVCGITLRRDGQLSSVAASGEMARRADELQYGRGRGPCLDALGSGVAVVVADLATDERWGDYRADAVAEGVRSSVSVPVTGDGAPDGALNLYTRAVHRFDDDEVARASAFARRVGGALAVVRRHASQTVLERQLRDALASRALIDQAMGMLMAQRRCPASTAFAALREASQLGNRKLAVIATELIEQLSGQPPEPPRPFTER